MVIQELQRTCRCLIDVNVAGRKNAGHRLEIIGVIWIAQGGLNVLGIVAARNVAEDIDIACAGTIVGFQLGLCDDGRGLVDRDEGKKL